MGGAQGRPQHHDEPERRRQAGQLHRGLRGAARAPRRLHRRADRGVRAPRHARHLVCPCLGRHAARAPDPRHARATAPPRCAPSPKRPASWCASTRAPTAASMATACAAANGSPGSSARDRRRLSRHQGTARSDRPVQPRTGSSIRRSMDEREPVPLSRPDLPDDRAEAGARLVGLERAERPGHRGDHGARQRRRPQRRLRQGRGDVQQQRPLPQVRCRHHVPELSRHPRRAAPDPRPRQHLASRAVGPARGVDAVEPLASDAVQGRWIFASAARAASATARPASTWRG